MAKERKEVKLNKDKLVPGVAVNEKDYLRVMAEQRKKDPYNGMSASKTASKIIKNSNTEDYARSVATDRQSSFKGRENG